ncbi:MAG: DUF2567 domain-containing protein [Pseudonocardiaceae bacterium]
MSAEIQTVHPPGVVDSPSPVVVRADVLPAWRVLCVVAALGLPLGWLWSWLAPPQLVGVVIDPASGRIGLLPLLGQSEHRFEAMAVFVLLGMAAGLLTGATLWLLRRRRGPVILVAAVLGSLVAAWFAMYLGVTLAGWRSSLVEGRPGEVLTRPPVLESDWIVVVQPFGTALAYSIMVAWNGTEDLGRGPS